MYKKIALVFGFFTFSSTLFAQKATEVLTLENAVATALERNYAIKVAKTQVKLAENDNTRGNAGMLPTVIGTVQPNATLNNTNQTFFDAVRPPLEQRGILNRSVAASVQMTWTLFDGMSMYILKNRLAELVKSGEAQAQVTLETTVANVVNTYFTVVQLAQQVRTYEDALVISRERRRLAKDRFDIGQGSKVDFLNSQVDFNADTAILIAQRQVLTNTKTQLNQLLARELSTDFRTADTLLLNRNLIFESLREQTLSQNPQLIVARYNNRVANIDIKNQQALLWPTVDLLTSYTYNAQRNGGSGFGVKSGNSTNLVGGVRLSSTIFDGLNQRRRIQGAKITEEVTRQQEEDLKLQLLSSLEQTYASYRNNLNLLDLEYQNISVAQQNVRIAFDRYKIGVAASLELREAQRNAVAAETRLIQAQFNAKLSEIELMRLSSQIVN